MEWSVEHVGRREIERLIDEQGLGEDRDAILAAIRPGYRLSPDGSGSAGGRTSHRASNGRATPTAPRTRGSLAIVIRLEDLAAGRYDRMVTDTSTG